MRRIVSNGPSALMAGLLILALQACEASFDAEASDASTETEQSMPTGPQIQYGMVIHGGAGTILRENMSEEVEAEYRAKLTEALEAGHAILQAGGSSLDAVEATIHVMEDSPLFNAGRGAVFTNDGRNSLDASIMDGGRLMAGAVSGVEDVRNPITLARHVMEDSPHVMLSGRGAEEFARLQGIESTPADYFFTERRWEALQRAKADESGTAMSDEGSRPDDFDRKFGTVGAVALDQTGNITAGTSTGGMTNKRWDRIGDAPILGAGTYADAECGISGTGWGEFFMRNVVAYDICARRAYMGVSLEEAADQVIMQKLEEQEENTGGVVGLDRDGHIIMTFNTPGMYRGYVDQDGNVTVEIFQEN